MLSVKQKLHEACMVQVQQKIKALTETIQQVQQSANEETKSSAGDKYETGRAMAQLEIEKTTAQLNELEKQVQALNRINPLHESAQVKAGSLVYTNRGNFYIAVHAGELKTGDETVYALSPDAPIAQKMINLTVGDSFFLNGNTFTIFSVL